METKYTIVKIKTSTKKAILRYRVENGIFEDFQDHLSKIIEKHIAENPSLRRPTV